MAIGSERLLPPEAAINSAVRFKPKLSTYSRFNISHLSNITKLFVFKCIINNV